MALTNDEINEILELYGRGYSGRKIAGKTIHSEVTVYYHIRRAKKRVTDLIAESIDADQIVSQLDYPVSFVNHVIRETDLTQITDVKDIAEIENTEEEIESPLEVDVQADWDNYQKNLEFEQCKDELLERVMKFLESLRSWEEHFKEKHTIDGEFQKRQSTFERKLEDFVLE